MLKYLVETSIRLKWVMLVLLIALMGAGGFAVELVFGVVSRVVCLYGVDQHMAVYEY